MYYLYKKSYLFCHHFSYECIFFRKIKLKIIFVSINDNTFIIGCECICTSNETVILFRNS